MAIYQEEQVKKLMAAMLGVFVVLMMANCAQPKLPPGSLTGGQGKAL